ncbi:MAG: XRE family transcriptional regulator [Oxalobacteraceae bacterium]|nr:MAG: XRE family transcriptional regulator [Oxalobacteraceae bacterium]
MDVRRKLGFKVQALRATRGWSQDDFAHRAGLHRTYVSGVERGVRNPTVTVLEKLAAALQVELTELLRFD